MFDMLCLLSGTDAASYFCPSLSPSSVNRVTRIAKLNLDSSGNLTGRVEETRTGPAATSLREELLAVPKIQRQKVFQNLLSRLFQWRNWRA
jgi:hypothetical protein